MRRTRWLVADQLIMQFGGGHPETIRTPLSRDGSFTANGVSYSRQ